MIYIEMRYTLGAISSINAITSILSLTIYMIPTYIITLSIFDEQPSADLQNLFFLFHTLKQPF